MNRWLAATLACVAGGAVSIALLMLAGSSHAGADFWVAAQDVPAGAQLSANAITLATVEPGTATGQLFPKNTGPALLTLRATHDLRAGQLIQRSDVSAQDVAASRRLVFLPIKDVPPVDDGSAVDLMVVTETPDGTTVQPFATGVVVDAVVAGGLIVAVAPAQTGAFVYAAVTMSLVAVAAQPSGVGGGEEAVSSVQQAIDLASQP